MTQKVPCLWLLLVALTGRGYGAEADSAAAVRADTQQSPAAGLCIEGELSEEDAAHLSDDERLLGSAAAVGRAPAEAVPGSSERDGSPGGHEGAATEGPGCDGRAQVERVPAPIIVAAQTRADLLRELERATTAEERERALDGYKGATRRWPDDEELHIALAIAYLRDGNVFWALKVLGEFQLRRPPACAARTVEAWLRYQQGELDEAAEAARDSACAGAAPEVRARRHLILARIADARGNAVEALRELRRARAQGALYDEDGALLDQLRRRYEPGYLPTWNWRLAVAAGWTSNGRSGTSVDTQAPGTEHSGLGEVGLDVDWVYGGRGMVRPTLGLGLRFDRLTSDRAREFSFLEPSLRPGIIVGQGVPRLRVGYRGGALALWGGDRLEGGPFWYTESHAGELELTVGPGYTAFINAGHRWFRDRLRSRTEIEHGLVWAGLLNPFVRGAVGGSARTYFARHRAYDQLGATALASLHVGLFPAWQLRQHFSLSVDDYPDSRGHFSSEGGGLRRELSSYLGAGLWRRLGRGVSAAAELSRRHRDSEADADDFEEFRALLRLTWASDWFTLSQRRIGSEAHATLGRVEPGEAGVSPRLDTRELMRQDEAAQRGFSYPR